MDIAAFSIACLGLFIAVLSLGWQVASWALEGRRVRVVLKHGAMGPGGSVSGPVECSGRPRDLSAVRAEGFTGTEVLGVTVTNIGRAPVTVSKYSANLVKAGFSFSPIGNRIGPELPFRLPPGESETWYAHALASATATVKRHCGKVSMSVELGTGDVKTTARFLRV